MDSKRLERLQGDDNGLTEAVATQEERTYRCSCICSSNIVVFSLHKLSLYTVFVRYAIVRVSMVCVYVTAERRNHRGQQMWQFILETLSNDTYNPDLITWVDRDAGVFKFVQSKRVAQLWNKKRGGANTFEHFSRSMR